MTDEDLQAMKDQLTLLGAAVEVHNALLALLCERVELDADTAPMAVELTWRQALAEVQARRCVLCGNPSPRLDPLGVCAACRMPAQVPPPGE
jgi:hypothetical protein